MSPCSMLRGSKQWLGMNEKCQFRKVPLMSALCLNCAESVSDVDSLDIALIYPPPFLTQLSKCPGRRKRLKLTHSSLETIFNFLPHGEMNRQRGEFPNTSLLLFHCQGNCSSNMKNSIYPDNSLDVRPELI